MIEQGKTILLDDDKTYVVVSTTVLNNKKYLFLVSEDQKDIKFGTEEEDEQGKKVVFLDENENASEIVNELYRKGVEEYNKAVNEINNNQTEG